MFMIAKVGAAAPFVAGAAMLLFMAGPSQSSAVSVKEGASAGEGETLGFALTGLLQAMDDKPNCPNGVNKNMVDFLLENKPPAERTRLLAAENGRELSLLTRTVQSGEFKGQPVCNHPEATNTPPLKVVAGAAVIPGFDLDGASSITKSSGKSCAHQNFKSAGGEEVIDNELYRIRGCMTAERKGGIVQTTNQATLVDGSYSILLEVSGVNDRRNDPQVDVTIYSSPDPTPFSRSGKSMPWGSMTPSAEKRFITKLRGRIVNGVLSSNEPTTINIYAPSDRVKIEHTLYQGRLQLTLKPDGTAEGIVGGYRKIDEYYFNHMIFRKNSAIAEQAAYVGNYMCPSFFRALSQYADGLRNPQTGKCEGISTALVLTAQPAFITR